jgi:ribonuclease HII
MLSLAYEKRLARRGFKLVAGVDEVGRGPLAGPIVAAAVILPLDCSIKGLNDSKKLSPRQREKIFPQIRKQAIAIGLGSVGHRQIDRIGIGPANILAMERAIAALRTSPDHLLLDGGRSKVSSELPQKGITGGDRKCASIAAASISAKVIRDRLMVKYHKKFPLYGFAKHKGYGTRRHIGKIREFGPCPIHRRSFYPVSALS